ncbi:AsnC family transcriptional regulator [Actinomyces capricornis]|uniref:AsnC family transcriptional regulator n=2 Tax=Actinomyces capricornis TaxID=2755559 RepID=A0ABM7UEE1_9ACTO|nr:AsnC family transcriptional regulator [Actinomyces capricornis]
MHNVPMSPTDVLDDLDRGLIAALRKNARKPVAELARDLGTTRATITKRIERLEARGIIQGFTIIVAQDADDSAIRAICHLAIEGHNTDAAIVALRGLPAITGLHATNGEWDLIAEITVATLAEVDHVLTRIRALDGVYRSETSLLLRSVLV